MVCYVCKTNIIDLSGLAHNEKYSATSLEYAAEGHIKTLSSVFPSLMNMNMMYVIMII